MNPRKRKLRILTMKLLWKRKLKNWTALCIKWVNPRKLAYAHETIIFYDNNLKQALGFKNPFYLKKAQHIRPVLYDGNVIAKETNVISIADSEEILMLDEESRSKMLLKQSDPMILVNVLSHTRTVTDEHAFPLQSHNTKTDHGFFACQIEAPRELSKNNTYVNQTEPTFDQLFELNNLKAEFHAKDTTIKKLKVHIKRVNETSTCESVKKDINEIETINIELEHRVARLIAENEHLKQTYKQLYDSIKPSRVRAKEQAESLVNQLNQNIKNDLKKFKGKYIVENVAQASNATTIAPGMYKLDPVTLAPKVKNNREAHKYYLKHNMEQPGILWEIVKQAKSLNPLDSASYSACKYVKLIQELLGYVRDTCLDIHKTRVNPSTSASGSKPFDNTKNYRIPQTPNSNEKNKVENPVKGAKALCSICNECLFDANHAMCLIGHANSMNVRAKSASKKNKKRKECKPTGKVFNSVGYKWKPTGSTFTLVLNACPLTRLTATNKVPLRVPIPLEVVAPKHVVTRVYTRRPKVPKSVQNSKPKVVQIVLWYLDSGCSRHMTGDRSQLTNFIHKFLGTVKFGNDQVVKIMGYGDYQIGNVTISRVYYMEGLGHNLFSVGQFCDSDLEVAFRKHTCFVRNLKKQSHKPKSKDTNQEKLYLLHMDLCGPMHVASVNGKKYILFIVYDYSRFTWVKFLASKDEAPDFIIKFLKMIQVRFNVPVRNIRTDNGTEFVNQTLQDYYEEVGIDM
ncbi:retrovirus-related pol polyprotein from transposon TNT 1-94 [Tanacetum coccineum]